MKSTPARGQTARVDEQAIERAERELEKPPKHWERPAFAHVPLQWISERPDLFPPPAREVGREHTDDLVRLLAQGEAIDPPLLIMLDEQWVCVEGHDRIAAYRTLEPKQTIKCEWFDGTVREAADEQLSTLRRNAIVSIEHQQGGSDAAEPTEALDLRDNTRSRLVEMLRMRPPSTFVHPVPIPKSPFTSETFAVADNFDTPADTPSQSRPRAARRKRATTLATINHEELQAATYATLRAHATSDEAKALVVKLAGMVEGHGLNTGTRKNRRRSTAEKLVYATGAFLADLLRSYGDDKARGWVYRSLKRNSFTGAPVTRRTFEPLVDGLKGLAFLNHVPGHEVAEDRDEDTTQYASRFRATPALLRFCSEHGVEPEKSAEHFEFEYDLPKRPVELRARKEKDYYSKTVPTGRVMEFDRTDAVAEMENRVRELNAYFAKQTLRGGSHHGYVRIFSNGDDPDFDWNKGGRFYSQHFKDSYQVMPSARRRMMTINGEPVAEIDISASYLTIFLSMHGIQLDTTKDPYEVPGYPGEHRTAVKQWFVATFGSAQPIRRWAPRMLKNKPELRQYRVAEITDAIISKYPAVATWGRPMNGRNVSWADLMFVESDVMFGAMLNLMGIHDTPSLSVHDSLIVPASKVKEASEAIKWSLHAKQRVVPILNINPPLTSL